MSFIRKIYYKFSSEIYLLLRNVRHKQIKNQIHDFYVQDNDYKFSNTDHPVNINGRKISESMKPTFFYGENTFDGLPEYTSWHDIIPASSAEPNELWWNIIYHSKIPEGFINSNLYQTGYILDKKIPTLSSWIWTSAAISRVFYEYNKMEECVEVADRYQSLQKKEGGWIVRNDQSYNKVMPAYAPNDSAYIARHALLNAYKLTNKQSYLKSAEDCARWIIKNTNELNLVPTNIYELNQNIIVDVGFTMSLFAELYKLTNNQEYLDYLVKFKDSFLTYFYNNEKKLFSTSIDNRGRQYGGYFSRGQAWALEGLIDVYDVIPDDLLFSIIDSVITKLTNIQFSDGSWSYNFSRPYLGVDNKGIAVIGNVIMEWHKYGSNKQSIKESAEKAFAWNEKHTRLKKPFIGGIFDFCFEGAITKHFNSETAFLYTNAYALILRQKLKDY